MKLTIVSQYGIEQQIEEYEITMIEFEDQTSIKNGMWLNVWTKEKEFSISFDPKHEWFRIEQ